MHTKATGIWSAPMLLTTLLACSAAGQQTIPRIINGLPTDEFESVGIVGTLDFGGFCTGTLVSEYHVLTAAHCAELADSRTAGTFEIAGHVFTTSQIYIHPDYRPRTLDNDLAIYQLSEPVEGITPSPIFRDIPQVGDQLTIVGFGAGGDGASGEDGTFGIKRVGTTTIDAITETLVVWQFDSEAEANTAPGDSGGPAFLLLEGEYHIVAVTSSGTDPAAGLGDIAMNTRVDAYATWIDSVVSGQADDDDADDDDQDDMKCPAENGHRPGSGGPKPAHRPVGPRPGWQPTMHRPWNQRPGGAATAVGGHVPVSGTRLIGVRGSQLPLAVRPVRGVQSGSRVNFETRLSLNRPANDERRLQQRHGTVTSPNR